MQLPLVVPILYFLIVTLLVAVPLVTKPKESAIGLAMMLSTGVAYYLLVIVWTSKPTVLVNKMGTSATAYYNVYNFYRASYASTVLAVIVCLSVRLSVRLSVTSRSCTKMAKPKITLTTAYDSPGTLVFRCQNSRRNSNDITPNGGAN